MTGAPLPNAAQALIPEAKLTGYLLNPNHPGSGGKAQEYWRLGYNDENAAQLRQDLLDLAANNEVTHIIPSPYGRKYLVAGTLRSPLGLERRILTVWIILHNEDYPRLVTAYPQ